jgi:hypothetical protein
MAITINGSGITSSEIADGTITNADINASAAIVGSKLSGAGKVLQVVNVLTTTQASQTLSTSDTQVGLLTKSITPLGANSKFLISVRWFGEVNAAWQVLFNIQQDGTRVNINGQGRNYGLAMPLQSFSATGGNDDSSPENVTFTTLVSTSSVVGTAIVFKVVADSTTTYTLWNNRPFNSSTLGGYERGTSELIITEIGA